MTLLLVRLTRLAFLRFRCARTRMYACAAVLERPAHLARPSVMFFLWLLAACAPQEQPYVADHPQSPALTQDSFTASDGHMLPVRAWVPRQTPNAVIIALHGFNDYSHAFSGAGDYFTKKRIALYAYDQRGFGATDQAGIWGNVANFTQDLREFSGQVAKRYPRTPLYILGESMGGAVAIAAATNGEIKPKGLILVAPAIWGSEAMPFAYRAALWTSAHAVPYWRMTGSDLRIRASNNMPMLRRMAADPLVIKATRVDAVYGLAQLMGEAYERLPLITTPTLLLYGGHDEVIRRAPMDMALARLPASVRFAYYPDSYHMMLRDLQAEAIMADIARWVLDKK